MADYKLKDGPLEKGSTHLEAKCPLRIKYLTHGYRARGLVKHDITKAN